MADMKLMLRAHSHNEAHKKCLGRGLIVTLRFETSVPPWLPLVNQSL